MNLIEIQNIISEIIQQITSIEIKEENFDEALTGKKINLSAIDLTYLFLELKNEYKIEFTFEDLHDYNFNTVNKIAHTILSKDGYQNGNC
jgi:hypothetical protein